MKDRTGQEYAEQLGIQRQQLYNWSTRLAADCYQEVAAFCRATNQQARTSEDKHLVYRGQDIVQLIMDWPTFNPIAYPAPVKPEESVLDCV